MAASLEGNAKTGGSPKASFRAMLAYALMMSIGAGVLSLPQQVARTGVVAALVVAVYVGLGILWCMLLMLRTKTRCEARGIRIATYQDFGSTLLGGDVGRRFVEIAVCLFQFGVMAVYCSFIPSTLSSVFPNVFGGARRFMWLVVFYPAFCVLCSLRYLRELGGVAQAATAAYCVGWVLVVAYCVMRVYQQGAENTRLWPKHSGLCVAGFFGAQVYSFEGIPAALCQMIDTLDQRERAGELITIAMLLILAMYVFTQYVGAFAFARPSDPLTVSLAEHSGSTSGVAIAVNLCVVVAVFLKYPLQFFPMISIIERNLNFGPGARLRGSDGYSRAGDTAGEPLIKKASAEDSVLDGDDTIWISQKDSGNAAAVVAFRSLLILLSVVVAYVVDDLTEMINLVGILFAPLLAIILPCVFDIVAARKLGPPEPLLARREALITHFMLATGSVAWIFGSAQEIIKIATRSSS